VRHGSVTELLVRLKEGDSSAVRGLWLRYFPRLVALARSTLNGRPRRAADEEDAAVSAFTSFWERADRGGFADLENRESLWALLAVLTIRKALKQARDEARLKRGGGQVLTDTDITQWFDGRLASSPLSDGQVRRKLRVIRTLLRDDETNG